MSVRTRVLALNGVVLGLAVTLAPSTPNRTDPPSKVEVGPLPDSDPYDPCPAPLPPGAVCRIQNTAFRHPARVIALSISADGATAYTVAGNATFAWDLRTGRLRWESRGVPEV